MPWVAVSYVLPGQSGLHLLPKLSIIIANYNYGAFLQRCLESALAQTYPNTEVIIVDDGSTDASAQIAASFAPRVDLVLKEHSGESESRNAGFARSTGDLIIFLDADDYLKPEAADALIKRWDSSYSKMQFHLQVVDERGNESPLLMPRCRLDSGRVENLLLTTGRYVTSPGSGNCYARWFLEKIVPIPTDEWPQSFDSYAATYAAFHGEIGAIQEPLGFYRVHAQNMSRIASEAEFGVEIAQLKRLMGRGERLRNLILKIASDRNLTVAPGIVTSHWMYLKLEIARFKLVADTPWRNILSSGKRMIKSALTSHELTIAQRLQLIAWTIGTILLPKSAAGPLIRTGFDLAPGHWLVQALRRL